MADTTEVLQHPAVRAYLTDVHRAVAAKDPAAADGVLAGVADHIRDAAADAAERGDDLDLDAVFRELGDPLLIAADVDPAITVAVAPTSSSAPGFADTWGGVILVAVLLSVGTWLLTIFAWAAAIWLLWSSRRWTRGDKIAATLWWPLLVLVGSVAPALGAGALPGWHLIIVVAFLGSIGLAVWLVARGARTLPPRSRQPRPTPVARTGGPGLLDRWAGASVAVFSPALAVAAVAVPALATGSWASLTVTATAAGAVLILGTVVLWTSRGWRSENRVWHTGTTALAGLVAGFLVATTVASGSPLLRCGTDGCTELARRLADPAGFVASLALYVLPVLVLHAVTTASTFRSGAAPARRLDSRGTATAIVLTLLLGTAGITLILATGRGWPAGLPWAVCAAAVWGAGATLLTRSTAWRTIDRVAAFVPALVVSWLCAVGSPFGSVTGAADPANPLVPSPLAADTPTILVVLTTVQLAASLWLLARAGVFRRTGGE